MKFDVYYSLVENGKEIESGKWVEGVDLTEAMWHLAGEPQRAAEVSDAQGRLVGFQNCRVMRRDDLKESRTLVAKSATPSSLRRLARALKVQLN